VHRFPTVDGGVWAEAELLKIIDAVEAALTEGQVIYLHCYGGHGRAGIVVRKTPFLEQFIVLTTLLYKNYLLAKTGSGQT
jgi:hypothetical protein